MSRQPVTSEDLLAAGAAARDALAHVSEAEWGVQPPRMEWTRFTTGSHICGALQFYATQVAVGSSSYTATIRVDEAQLKAEELPEHVKSQASLLATAAAGVPSNTRAWHPTGLADVEGFLAMGCAEVLLHCWDATNGTEIEFVGDEGIAGRTLQRLFPWAPTDTPPWETLLFATGRGELDGHDSPGERWMWHNSPLDEWDGREPCSDRWVSKK